jgi:hypothetical protein
MNDSELKRCFGKSISLKVRRSDGQTVLLDFAKPIMRRNPMRFYGTTKTPDPLEKKTGKYPQSAHLVKHAPTVERQRI